MHPCISDVQSKYFHHDMVREAYQRCVDAYEALFLQQLMEMCPRVDNDQIFNRRRREPFTLATIGVVTAIAGIGIGVTATAVSFSNKGRISTLEDRQEEIKAMIAGMEVQIKKNHDDIRNLTLQYNKAIGFLEDLQVDHDELKGKLISTNYAISTLMSKFMIGRTILLEAIHLWKEGRISQSLLDYLQIKLPCSPNCPVSLAQAISCNMSHDRKRMLMLLYAPIVSKEVSLVKADPFEMMVRKGNTTCSATYTGPKYLILSEKNNCVYEPRRIDETSSNPVIMPEEGCSPRKEADDSGHFTIQKCVPTRPKDELDFVQVKMLNNHVSIYCPESNLTLEGVEGRCSDHIMTIPDAANFTINGMRYQGSSIRTTITEKMDPFFTMKANWHIQPSFNGTSLKGNVSEIDDFKEINVYQSQHFSSFWMEIGLIALVCLMFIIIVYLIKKSNKPMKVQVTAVPSTQTEITSV